MHRRIVVAVAIGLLSAALCYARLLYGDCSGSGVCLAGDFTEAMSGARELLGGNNPYLAPSPEAAPPGPTSTLPALLIALPFALFAWQVGGALFFGVSAGLLAFGLFRDGFDRWPFFLSAPFWFALIAVQWSPLLVAAALLPPLLPLALARPALGLPIFLSHAAIERFFPDWKEKETGSATPGNRESPRAKLTALYPPWLWGVVSLALLVASVVVMPSWVQAWLAQPWASDVFVPVWVLPGVVLLVAGVRWRRREARLLLLLSLVPQRPIFDQLLLWLVPRSTGQMFLMAAFSWITIVGWLLIPEPGVRWIILGMYGPALVMLFLDSGESYRPPDAHETGSHPPEAPTEGTAGDTV